MNLTFTKIKEKIKEKQNIIIIIGAVATVLVLYIALPQIWKKARQENPVPTPSAQELFNKKQAEELDKLRKESGAQPLTNQEIKAQIDELNALREEASLQPLSPNDIQKQLEELEKLRQSSQ